MIWSLPSGPIWIGGYGDGCIEDTQIDCRLRETRQAHLVYAASLPPFPPWDLRYPDEEYRKTFG